MYTQFSVAVKDQETEEGEVAMLVLIKLIMGSSHGTLLSEYFDTIIPHNVPTEYKTFLSQK